MHHTLSAIAIGVRGPRATRPKPEMSSPTSLRRPLRLSSNTKSCPLALSTATATIMMMMLSILIRNLRFCSIWPEPGGLWFNELVPEAAVHAAWRRLAALLCAEWHFRFE